MSCVDAVGKDDLPQKKCGGLHVWKGKVIGGDNWSFLRSPKSEIGELQPNQKFKERPFFVREFCTIMQDLLAA